ncbi:hypothetical protein [Micromonospora pallida]|uniref:hypothetical protein n=1 Tax=Micromonospora pallida TaxID=145854 RepID=UPI001C402F23|nr:hypothetical protein [Micromonospora pallida]
MDAVVARSGCDRGRPQIGWLKSGMYDEFRNDLAKVVRAAGVPTPKAVSLLQAGAELLGISAGIATVVGHQGQSSPSFPTPSPGQTTNASVAVSSKTN